MKNVTILFGEMGGGKNYHGEKMAKWFGDVFFDGDTVIPPEMAERVANFKPLTRDMIDSYIDILIDEIDRRAIKSENGLIVAQALYFNQDRKEIKFCLEQLGYRVIMCWVRPSFWRNFKQIQSRPNGWRWVLYWLMSKPFFQKPTHEYQLVAH